MPYSFPNYYIRQLKKLIDGKIVGTIVSPQDQEPVFFGLQIEMPDKTIKLLWFQSDDEGNDSGSFSIEDMGERN